ncbi:MAG TPA: alcohol dehydrogenase catalytic domain-containing protein [Bacteroidales bacterium]|nr:alcohol dehydrogenase catalytic domain-containing protein [Bacteroidales bacterium]HPT22141.1 alcohol dehydrogenase catalytic domain-containing protein [Bacteroidales bacterium]
MKAMMLTGIRQMEMKNIPEPEITKPDDVKIKITVVGICGSDIHYYTSGQIGSQVVKYPFTVGHEGAGVVVEVGSGVTRVRPGDSIAIDPAMPCWECDQCRSGRSHTCRHLRFLGCPGQAEGCLMEYIVMPEESCFPLTGRLTPDHGSISEPLAIGVYAVKKSGFVKGLKTGIFGFGPIGMSVMLDAKAKGADKIYVTDKIDARLGIASKEKADGVFNPLKENITEKIREKEKLGLDIVFECCGEQEAFDQAVDILKPGGKLIIVGIPGFDRWSMPADEMRRKELSVQFIRRQVGCVDSTLEMMKNGIISIDNMVTHRFPFDKTKEAFDLVAGYEDGVMKAMIDF